LSNKFVAKCATVLLGTALAIPTIAFGQRATDQQKPPDNLAEAKAKKGGKIKVAVIPQDRDASRQWTKDIMMAALEDALVGSGRFAVLSRSELSAVMAEQKFANSDMVDPAAAVRIGKALAAQYVVIIRTVSLERKEGGFTFGGMGNKKSILTSNVQMQLIDTESTQIIESKSYSDKKENSVAVLGDEKENKVQAPGQDAYQAMVETFTKDFVNRLSMSIPIDASIVLVKGNLVAIDAGSDRAIKPGYQFEVFQEGEAIRDAAGNILSNDSTRMGLIKITRVEPKMSWAEVIQTFDASGVPDATPNPSKLQRDFSVKQLVETVTLPATLSNGKKSGS
jgi:curli biogenesis system outer membrane secretion channel CsgG